jgi:hypothetical protein
MVEEVIQWAVILLLTVLVVGLLRQMELRSPSGRFGSTDRLVVHRQAPRQLLKALPEARANQSERLVVFVTEGCVGCMQLLQEAEKESAEVKGRIVLIARNASPEFRAALAETGIETVFDEGGLWKDLGISATPLVVSLDPSGEVRAKEVTHHVSRLESAPS